MIDGCDKHGARAQKLLNAWNALFDAKEKALAFAITENGYFIQFRGGGCGGAGPTIDAAFDAMEQTIRTAAAGEVAEQRSFLDKAMARARSAEEALST